MMTRAWVTALVLSITIAALPGCDSGGEDEGPARGDVTGIVSERLNESPIPGALVRISSASATTGADGSYEISGVAVGSRTMEVSAEGYDAYSDTVQVVDGTNTHNVELARQSIFEYDGPTVEATALVPPETPRFRGVLLVFYGAGTESRGFVRGQINYVTELKAEQLALRERLLQLADDYSLVIVGFDMHDDASSAALRDVFASLDDVAAQTDHPEIAEAPLLIWGASFGGCLGYALVGRDVDRVIGLITHKGGCHTEGLREQYKGVPVYFFIGENDTFQRRENIQNAFEENRASGAIWALAVHPGGDHRPADLTAEGLELTIEWMQTVLDLRLPNDAAPDGTTNLIPMAESSGWLGDLQSFEIAPYDCYAGDALTASWLPTMATAQSWQHFVSEGAVTTVTPCP